MSVTDFDKICEECDSEFSSFIETVCDDCHDEHQKSVDNTIEKLKSDFDELLAMADRLNEVAIGFSCGSFENDFRFECMCLCCETLREYKTYRAKIRSGDENLG
jgi:hypothetical protein